MKNYSTKEKSGSSRPVLEIYSASGVLLSTIPWKSGQVVHLGWTVTEDLLCIQEDGTVLVYDIFCEFKRHFSMGNEVKQNQVLEAKVFHTEYGTGIAILTRAFKFTITSNIDDLKLRRMAEIPGPKSPPSCWTVLFQDRVTMVLIAIGKELYLLDNTSYSILTLPGASPLAGAYLQMSVSFNYKYLALFTDSGYIWMGTSSLKEKLCEFTSNIRVAPKQMAWCIRPRSKHRAVALMWEKLLVVAGNSAECISYPLRSPSISTGLIYVVCKFPLDEESYMVPELDGVRIFSRSTHEFLHEIPKVTEEIFKIASMAPGALLLEAQKEYELTIPVLLDRLVLRRLYPLAIKICEYLKLSDFQGVSRILAHWACYKVQQKEKSDEEVAQAINQKLGDTPGISYSEIASKACDCGRTELAIKLLEYEPRSGEQVPLLLKMKRSKLALSKAIESGDTDLVYTVVSYLKNELNRGEFFMTLQNQPVALSLYRQFCKHQELETLKDLYNQDDDHQELGNFHVRASYGTDMSIESRVAALQNAVDEYNKAKNELAAKATEDQIKLLRKQRELQDQMDKPYLDNSLHDTVYNLILDGMQKKAEQLYKEFKIPDKRYWWLKISALAEKEDWEELEKFSKTKKSAIGYLPFVEICMKHQNKFEAKKYALRVNPDQRVKAFLLVRDLDQAAEAAIEHKNENEMNLVLSKCTSVADNLIAEKINRAKAQTLKK
ncbi:hypothetical protein FKM82_015712 [Ascaphus truei]